MLGIHLKNMRDKSNVRKYSLIFIEHQTIQIQKFIKHNITTIATSKVHAFKEFLRPMSVLPNSSASWRMRFIYTSKGMMKMFGCALYIRRALSIEKYGMLFI
jgi:hypothetical protein